jgi:hypothetical protein
MEIPSIVKVWLRICWSVFRARDSRGLSAGGPAVCDDSKNDARLAHRFTVVVCPPESSIHLLEEDTQQMLTIPKMTKQFVAIQVIRNSRLGGMLELRISPLLRFGLFHIHPGVKSMTRER